MLTTGGKRLRLLGGLLCLSLGLSSSAAAITVIRPALPGSAAVPFGSPPLHASPKNPLPVLESPTGLSFPAEALDSLEPLEGTAALPIAALAERRLNIDAAGSRAAPKTAAPHPFKRDPGKNGWRDDSVWGSENWPESDAKFQRLRNRIRKVEALWKLPIEELMREHDVLLLGENHDQADSVSALTSWLPRFKESGVVVAGFEGFHLSIQDDLDRLMSGSRRIPIVFSKRNKELQALLHGFRQHGVRPLALDLESSELADKIARKAAASAKIPIETVPQDLATLVFLARSAYWHGLNDAVTDVVYKFREKIWTRKIAQSLAQGGKAVVLAGDGHLRRPPGMRHHPVASHWTDKRRRDWVSKLRAAGLRVFSVSLTGGLFLRDSSDDADIFGRSSTYRLAQAAGLIGRKGFVRTSKDTGIFNLGLPHTKAR